MLGAWPTPHMCWRRATPRNLLALSRGFGGWSSREDGFVIADAGSRGCRVMITSPSADSAAAIGRMVSRAPSTCPAASSPSRTPSAPCRWNSTDSCRWPGSPPAQPGHAGHGGGAAQPIKQCPQWRGSQPPPRLGQRGRARVGHRQAVQASDQAGGGLLEKLLAVRPPATAARGRTAGPATRRCSCPTGPDLRHRARPRSPDQGLGTTATSAATT